MALRQIALAALLLLTTAAFVPSASAADLCPQQVGDPAIVHADVCLRYDWPYGECGEHVHLTVAWRTFSVNLLC